MSRRPAIALLLVASALLGGCADDLTGYSLLIRSRALAGRVEVVGEPTRATPRPGETAEAEIFIGDPGAEIARSYSIIVCEPSDTSLGTPVCANFDAPIAAASVPSAPTGPGPHPNPSVTFTVPTELAPTTKQLLLIGVFCAGGQTDLAGIFRYFGDIASGTAAGAPPICTDPALHGEIFTLNIPLELEPRDRNLNPAIARIGVAGGPFDAEPPPNAGPEDCAALPAEAPRLTWQKEYPLELSVTPASRETFVELDPITDELSEEQVETLQITYIATDGELERTHGFIDPPEESELDSLTWTPPPLSELSAEGEVVRFYFVLRDGRGGIDFAERALCISRP